MQALVVPHFGPPEVVAMRDVADPDPGPFEIVVTVCATTVTSGDARIRAARFPPGMGLLGRLMFGWSVPSRPILGVELAGVVEAVGASVTEYAPGDRVLAMTGDRMGAHAERCAIAVDHCVVHLSDAIAFDEAITLPFGGTTALTFLADRARLKSKERVLVIGASGAVGVASVQVAHLLGAEVTGVCSGRNAELVRSLGAARVIDYTRHDLFATDERWDVVIDTVGVATVAQVCALATRSGRVGLVAAGLPQMLAAGWHNLTSRRRVFVGPATESPVHLAKLVEWLGDGRWKAVIDRRLTFREGAQAHARVDSMHKVGSVVLLPERPSGDVGSA